MLLQLQLYVMLQLVICCQCCFSRIINVATVANDVAVINNAAVALINDAAEIVISVAAIVNDDYQSCCTFQ